MKQLHALHQPIVLVQLVQHVPLHSGNQLHVLQHKIVYVRLARYVLLVITKTLRALPLLIEFAQHARRDARFALQQMFVRPVVVVITKKQEETVMCALAQIVALLQLVVPLLSNGIVLLHVDTSQSIPMVALPAELLIAGVKNIFHLLV